MTSQPSRAVWLVPSDGRRWRFDPGSLSLAFGYTGEFGHNVDAWETLHGPADLDHWLTQRFGAALHPSGAADCAGAQQLRTAIVSAARHAASNRSLDAAAVDTTNIWASRHVDRISPTRRHSPTGATPALPHARGDRT